jgi:hypothetical protein
VTGMTDDAREGRSNGERVAGGNFCRGVIQGREMKASIDKTDLAIQTAPSPSTTRTTWSPAGFIAPVDYGPDR